MKQQGPLIRLDIWAASKLTPAPHRARLAYWARHGLIQPQPSKIGRDWYVRADACFVDRNGKPGQQVAEIAQPAAEPERYRLDVYSIEHLRSLPEPTEDAGLYFLWLGEDLQYVGISICVFDRVASHERACRIKFDRATCITVLDRPMFNAARYRMDLERAYIAAYRPRWNIQLHGRARGQG